MGTWNCGNEVTFYRLESVVCMAPGKAGGTFLQRPERNHRTWFRGEGAAWVEPKLTHGALIWVEM